jgi:hypothetical protein
MISYIDWWRTDLVSFEGGECLRDAADLNTTPASMRAIARIFVIRAAASAIGSERRGGLDGVAAASYLAALMAVEDPEAGALCACLAALQQNNTAALATALHEAARLSAAHLAPCTARKLAELSYEAALEVGAWQDALLAAVILERLATLDECPVAAERWARRADRQLRRVQRAARSV